MIYWTTIAEATLENLPILTQVVTDRNLDTKTCHRHDTAQKRSLYARESLRALLTHVTGDAQLLLSHTPHGKPFTITANGTAGPQVSSSHSNGMIACAISLGAPLGIDIEHHCTRSFTDLAAYAFGPVEQVYVKNGGIDAFYKIWTLREAISKISGEGVFAMIDGQDRVTAPSHINCWTDHGWHLYYTKLHTDFSLSIATHQEINWSVESLCKIDSADLF